MDSYNSSGLNLSADGSQLLDFSEHLPSDSSHSQDGRYDPADDADLSLGDLSLDQTVRMDAPFSLFSKPIRKEPSPPPKARLLAGRRETPKQMSSKRAFDPEDEPYDFSVHENADETIQSVDQEGQEQYVEEEELDEEEREQARRKAAKLREEKLQGDIFILKKLNAAFESFNDALDEAGSANQVRLWHRYFSCFG